MSFRYLIAEAKLAISPGPESDGIEMRFKTFLILSMGVVSSAALFVLAIAI